MKILASLLVLLIVSNEPFAQTLSQIRLKTGFSLLFPSPGGRGYAYKGADRTSYSVVGGVEYSRRFKNRKAAWHVGFTFQDSYANPTYNERNLTPINTASPPGTFALGFSGAPAKTELYAGVEWFINRDFSKPKKNIFSFIAGVGFAFTLNKYEDWGYTSRPERYQTRTGAIVEGYSSNFIPPSIPVSPSVYAGLRYNVVNRKGKEVFIVELKTGCGLTPLYKQTVDYTLDGVLQRDVLKERGFNMQLNLIVPLITFQKKGR